MGKTHASKIWCWPCDGIGEAIYRAVKHIEVELVCEKQNRSHYGTTATAVAYRWRVRPLDEREKRAMLCMYITGEGYKAKRNHVGSNRSFFQACRRHTCKDNLVQKCEICDKKVEKPWCLNPISTGGGGHNVPPCRFSFNNFWF